MKITIFNQDGSVKEVREHRFQIPDYILKYEPALFFTDVSEEDVKMVSHKGYDIDKDFLLNQYRFLIMYDFNNYKEYCLFNDCSFSILDCIVDEGPISEDLFYLDDILSSLLHLYRIPLSSIEGEWHSKIKEFFFSDLWIDVIVRHANNARFRKSNRALFTNVISIIRRLYSVMNKLARLDLLVIEDRDVMFGLYPFANIQSSISSKESVFDDDDVLAKVVESLHYRGAGSRNFIYALADMLESTISYGMPKSQGRQSGVISMMTTSSNATGSGIVTIGAIPSNGTETTEIQLQQEEIVCIRCPFGTIGKDVLNKLGDALKGEYDLFWEKNKEDVEKQVEIEVTRRKRVANVGMLTQRQWKDFYFESLDKLEYEYKSQYEKVKKLVVPYYYYYLLVEMCSSSQRYDFNNYFLESLVYMAIEKKFVERSQLYFQMSRLNYMEEEANIIKKDDAQVSEDSLGKKMEELRQGLLDSDYGEMTKELLANEYPKGLDGEALVQRIRVFLSPLFNKDYIVDMEVTEFEKYFNKILHNDTIITRLKNRDCYLPFNLKLVFNIIGYLSKDNKKYNSTVAPPLKGRLGNSLCEKIECLWKRRIPSNYRKCVSQYAHKLEKMNLTFTIFDYKIKAAVDSEWQLYIKLKERIKKTEREVLKEFSEK